MAYDIFVTHTLSKLLSFASITDAFELYCAELALKKQKFSVDQKKKKPNKNKTKQKPHHTKPLGVENMFNQKSTDKKFT